jgi:hypothetical protein
MEAIGDGEGAKASPAKASPAKMSKDQGGVKQSEQADVRPLNAGGKSCCTIL